MLALLAALAAAGQPTLPAAPPTIGRTAWVFSTIDHSEFCPAGYVRLDLRTGRYEVTNGLRRPACGGIGAERPVRTGTLPAARLADIRAAYLRVLTADMESRMCREGKRPDVIVISNGGTPILIVADGWGVGLAPRDLTCWSEAASFLQNLLDHQFRAERRR